MLLESFNWQVNLHYMLKRKVKHTKVQEDLPTNENHRSVVQLRYIHHTFSKYKTDYQVGFGDACR
jgi:hypothetical protein